jgi:excisionase family DNA binding protein
MERRTRTITEAAELIGVGRSAAYEAARTGDLPTIKIGHRILVPVAALERMLDLSPGILTKEDDAA